MNRMGETLEGKIRGVMNHLMRDKAIKESRIRWFSQELEDTAKQRRENQAELETKTQKRI